MEMTRNNVFFSVDCGGSEKSRLCSVLALNRAGFSLADIQSDCDGPVPLRRAAAYSYVFLLAYCSLV